MLAVLAKILGEAVKLAETLEPTYADPVDAALVGILKAIDGFVTKGGKADMAVQVALKIFETPAS